MNRKSLIMCMAALGAMLLAMVIAIAVLYHDGDRKETKVEPRYELFQAVPSDAVAMACLARVSDVSLPAFSGFGFLYTLSDAVSQGQFATLAESPMAVSLHYSGKLSPLYIFDVGILKLVFFILLKFLVHKFELLVVFSDCGHYC